MADESEFASFVRAHTGVLLRTAYLLTGSGVQAEELVQDTLVRLYPKWDRVASAEVPLAYVRRSLTNAFLSDRRRAARTKELAMETVPEPREASAQDPLQQLADRDALWDRLSTLASRQRAALVLRYFEDLPDEEIARLLGCRVGTVRSLISRGLAQLREQACGEVAARAGGPA